MKTKHPPARCWYCGTTVDRKQTAKLGRNFVCKRCIKRAREEQ